MEYALANAYSLDIKNIKLIIDGGFWSKDVIQNLNKMCLTFTMGMPKHLKLAKEMMKKHQKTIIKHENRLKSNYYCVSETAIINGVKGKILLYSNLSNSGADSSHV